MLNLQHHVDFANSLYDIAIVFHQMDNYCLAWHYLDEATFRASNLSASMQKSNLLANILFFKKVINLNLLIVQEAPANITCFLNSQFYRIPKVSRSPSDHSVIVDALLELYLPSITRIDIWCDKEIGHIAMVLVFFERLLQAKLEDREKIILRYNQYEEELLT